MLKDADLHIDGFIISREKSMIHAYTQRIDTDQNAGHLDADDFSSDLSETPVGNIQPRILRTQHQMIDSEDMIAFNMEEESNGTQRFFALAVPFLHALDHGAVMIVDELDCSLHPNLTRKLIELYQSPSANSRGAQLIFTTHDSTLIDQRIFRRDQIYLVEKMRNRGSEYFSLYDFDNKDRPRNTEALQRNYLSGRYGAVPQFGPTFEDFQLT
jgi:AAA15 family ATPase/GTPase